MTDMRSDRLTIGELARLSGLTVKALRHYDETKVLRPSEVDPLTGYRRYTHEQVAAALLVRRLRELEIPIAEITRVQAGGATAREALAEHLAALERRAGDVDRMIARLQEILDSEEDVTVSAATDPASVQFGSQVMTIADRLVVSIAKRIPTEEIPKFIPEAYAAIEAYLKEQGVPAIGPPFYICPFDDEGMVDGEAGVFVDRHVADAGEIRCRTLAGGRAATTMHKGHYEELDSTYRALDAWMDREGLVKGGPPRELYLNDPATLPAAEWLTEVVWPVES